MRNHTISLRIVLKILLVSILFVSCGGDSVNNRLNQNKSGEATIIEDSGKVGVVIPDADFFDPAWKKDNVLVYHSIGEPDDMHPCNGNSATRAEINMYTQIFLVHNDYNSRKPLPQLAEKLPAYSEGGLKHTYTIRNGLTWDDGSPISAEDVLFTLKANKCPLTNNPHLKPYLESIVDARIDSVNSSLIHIRMKDNYLLNVWLFIEIPILQRSFFDKENTLSKFTLAEFDNPKFNAELFPELKKWAESFNSPKYSHDPKFITGGGAYRFSEWEPGQYIAIEKKKNHWTEKLNGLFDKAYPDKIIFKLNRDPNSIMLDFKNQVFDASTLLDAKSLAELEKDSNFVRNYNFRYIDTYNYSYTAFNCRPDGIKCKKLFTDKDVRRAIAMLCPLDDINRIVNQNRNKRLAGPVCPMKSEYNNELKLIPCDIEQAKKILNDKGWRDTDGDNILDKVVDGKKLKFEFDLLVMNVSPAWKDMGLMMAETMKKAGIKCNVLAVDFSVLHERARNHDFDMLMAAWAASTQPDDFEQIWSTGSWKSKGSNWSGFGNATSDALIDSIKYEMDEFRRKEMSKRFQKMVYDEQPYVFMYSQVRRIAVHKRWGNQIYYFERPGLLLNNLKLLSAKK